MGRTNGFTTAECRNRRKVMARQVSAGKSVAEVARIHEVGMNCVYHACRIHQVRPPDHDTRRTIPAITRGLQAIRLMHQDKSSREIARRCHRSHEWVRLVRVAAIKERFVEEVTPHGDTRIR